MTLHVWTADDEEWVVAESAKDACAVYRDHVGGEEAHDANSADHGMHPDHWTELPDDRTLRFSEECPEIHKDGSPCPRACSEHFLIHTKMTCGEHVASAGRSYLGSAKW